MKKETRKRIIVFSIIIFVIATIICLNKTVITNIENKRYSSKLLKEQEEIKKQIEESEKKEKIEREVPTQNENKPSYYVGNFIGYINRKEYQNAYDVLNNDFKKNNFQNLEDFKVYCNKQYGGYMTVKIIDYKIVNDVFIIETLLTKVGNMEEISQFFTVKAIDETGDFEISFNKQGDNI